MSFDTVTVLFVEMHDSRPDPVPHCAPLQLACAALHMVMYHKFAGQTVEAKSYYMQLKNLNEVFGSQSQVEQLLCSAEAIL